MTRNIFVLLTVIALAVSVKTETARIIRSAETCGVSKINSGYIVRGESFSRGNFPWIVALTYTKVHPPIFFCAGTIISPSFVISAAHCINEKHSLETLLSRDILALFGAHALNNLFESGRYSLSPKKIILHGDWNPSTTQYDGDISILEFEKDSIYFNDFVQPICLWSSRKAPNVTEGIVPGWGKSENPAKKHENVPKMVEVSIQSNAQCLPGESTLARLSSYRTFCAGHNNGSGVCFGDSGGGLFIKIDGAFHLKGIVSSSLLKNGTECDVSRKAVYTDVIKFTNWISNKTRLALISSEQTAVHEAICRITFSVWSWFGRKTNLDTCAPDVSEVYDEEFTVSSSTNATIAAFDIANEKGVKFLPTNLFCTMPALIVIQIFNCSLTAINGSHFKGLSKLRNLNLPRNKLHNIPSDAFADLESLEELSLSYNRIQFLAENTFASLKSLKALYLSHNEIQVLHPKIFGSLVEVQNIDLEGNRIHAIDENIFEKAVVLIDVTFTANKLEKIPKNLFKKNLRLKNIWLDINTIKFVDANMFDHLQYLESVYLENNPCIDETYEKNDFEALRTDLKVNCNENAAVGETRGGSVESSAKGWFLLHPFDILKKLSFLPASREVFCAAFVRVWSLRNQIQTLETCKPDIDEIDDDFTISSATEATVSALVIEHKQGVKTLPTNLHRTFPELLTVQVLNCSVTSIDSDHFKGLAKLKFLGLAHNKIETVASDAFVDLVNLEQLLLSFNQIQFLGENIFSTLKALKGLHLGENKIKVLHPKIFGSLAGVEIINLKQNEVALLDENIFEKASNLKGISLAANKLEKIPKNLFKNNLKLEEISLNTNNIKSIDANMFDHLPRLNSVSLYKNFCINKNFNRNDFKMMRIDLNQSCNFNPTELANKGAAASNKGTICTAYVTPWEWNDREQNLDTCEPDIPVMTYKNYKLPYASDPSVLAMNIDDKKYVVYLPNNLTITFPELILIQIYNCSVTSVDNHFAGLSKLRSLNLAHNRISYVARAAFVDLVSLESLDLSANRIQTLGKNTFGSLENLERLFLIKNKIQMLPSKIFRSLLKVEFISLNENKLSALDENIFNTATNLKNLSVSSNELKKISKTLLKNNSKLENLWLGHNHLLYIEASMFDHLPNLIHVDLEQNSCINKDYNVGNFDAMRKYLEEYCKARKSL